MIPFPLSSGKDSFHPSVHLALVTRLHTVQGRFGVSFTFESHADFGTGIELGGIKYKAFIFQGKQTEKFQ